MDYHGGELKVQERAGLLKEASALKKSVRDHLPEVAARFIEQQVMLIIGLRDAKGLVWATVIYGSPGFVKALDPTTLSISSLPLTSDPAFDGIRAGQAIGMLAIDFSSKRRMRVNGKITFVHEGGFQVQTSEVYANCPKYIQSRSFSEFRPLTKNKPILSTQLNQEQMNQISQSNTFFIATCSSETGADASHRGGLAGFVQVVDQRTLLVQDYRGNAMFNTLGNIEANPQTGLLFLDFEAGDMLQMNGEAAIQWTGLERALCIRISQIRSVAMGFPLRWEADGHT
ncbi:pyridoxamine 5'-phosphate oxidase family protein [Paenibacillus sp. PL2-23]|uniref:pyridoxamine 5'-phosphate oxidase family protein n=1 Tax=Paenibacillus sp. PL2-23 TaxID=2100729 RepID=UPI0030F781EB